MPSHIFLHRLSDNLEIDLAYTSPPNPFPRMRGGDATGPSPKSASQQQPQLAGKSFLEHIDIADSHVRNSHTLAKSPFVALTCQRPRLSFIPNTRCALRALLCSRECGRRTTQSLSRYWPSDFVPKEPRCTVSNFQCASHLDPSILRFTMVSSVRLRSHVHGPVGAYPFPFKGRPLSMLDRRST